MTSNPPQLFADSPAVSDRLVRALSASYSSTYAAETFLESWFTQQLFFLFKKNLSVTNIQLAELLALLRTHIHLETGSGLSHLRNFQFLSRRDFRAFVHRLLADYPSMTYSSTHERAVIAATSSVSFFARTILIAPFNTSCAVFLPEHLRVDLESICAQSGYIHSCGHIVYIRNVEKSDKDRFFSHLDSHLNEHYRSGRRAFFAVYAHEDFTRYDRSKAEALRHGLDDVKIHVDKFYIGKSPLLDVIREMRAKYSETVYIPKAGDYRKVHDPALRSENIETSRSLWLITDADSPSEKGYAEPRRRFVICYDQLYRNKNPFHPFDENKPGWLTHTTTPHSLIAAMINLTQPWYRDTTVLCDPFMGTGTTLLEALKYDDVIPLCSDASVTSPLLTSDNYEFFCRVSEELYTLAKHLQVLIDSGAAGLPAPTSKASPSLQSIDKSYDWSVETLRDVLKDTDPMVYELPERTIDSLSAVSLDARIMFYLVLKAYIRHETDLVRESAQWHDAFSEEAHTFVGEIQRLADLRRAQETLTISRKGRISVHQDAYSHGCTFEMCLPANQKNVRSCVIVRDALKLEEDTCDIIIADPPYGLNVNEDAHNLARLYRGVFVAMIRALHDDGQIVLCLHDQSFVGHRPPAFVQKSVVVRQLLSVADELEREVINIAQAVPSRGRELSPPYYWQSERALRRAIVHVRVRKIRHS
jgi:hypothetical protein